MTQARTPVHKELGRAGLELSGFEPTELAAIAGALQLLPSNAHRCIRLQAFSFLTACLRPNNGTARITETRVRSVLKAAPFGDGPIPAQEDPFEGLFCDSVSFFGGEYLTVGGATDEDTYIISRLSSAIFLGDQPHLDERYRQAMYGLFRSALALSNEVCQRAGLMRGMVPGDTVAADVDIPARSHLRILTRAVLFAESELADAISLRGGELRYLQPLIANRGDFKLSDYRLDGGPLHITPLLRCSGKIVVVAPTLIMAALRSHAILAARHLNVIDQLAIGYHATVRASVHQSLRLLGNAKTSVILSGALGLPCCSETVCSIDSDKVVHVLVLTDTLRDFSAHEPFAAWTNTATNSALVARMQQVEQELYSMQNPPNSSFRLLVAQGVGGASFFGYSANEGSVESPLLYLGAASLSRIVAVEAGDPLALWKYVQVRHLVDQRIELHGWGEPNEFAFYRKHKHSFYRDDVPLGTSIWIQPGFGGELICEAAARYDWHGAPSPKSGGTISVRLAYGSRRVPIYIPDPPSQYPPAVLVNSYEPPIWVTAPENVLSSLESLHNDFCHLVAYWLWQMTPTLAAALSQVTLRAESVQIQIELDPLGDWDKAPDPAVENTNWISADADRDEAFIRVQIGVPALRRLTGPTNAGERELLCAVLPALLHIAKVDDADRVASDAIARHAPLGPKKKITILGERPMPELDTTGLPRFRRIQEADEGIALDALGVFLRQDLKLPPGEIRPDQRTWVLREVVGCLFRRLEARIATLTSDGLLEWLIAHHEAAMARRARDKLNLTTRIACFGPGEVEDIGREMQQEARANIANRFLIEYVAARPPKGPRPISLSVFDELMALGSLIFDYGAESDLIHFKLADIPMKMLPSGRLGANRESFDRIRRAYSAALSVRHADVVQSQFERLWRPLADTSEMSPELMDLEEAATEEFGLPLSHISDLMAELVNVAFDHRRVVALELRELVQLLEKRLSWPAGKLSHALDMMSLFERNDFLCPPEPHRRRDVEPWNFNRALSYLRKPLIRRGDQVLYGYRNIIGAREYLIDLCLSGRLQATSERMKRYVSRVHDREGRAFEGHVADELERVGGMKVIRGLKKVTSSGHKLVCPGDIDVLGADIKRRALWVLECKDLATSRTPSEFANEVKSLVAGSKAEKPTTVKHAARADWVRNNLSAILQQLKILDGKRWRVSSAHRSERRVDDQVSRRIADSDRHPAGALAHGFSTTAKRLSTTRLRINLHPGGGPRCTRFLPGSDRYGAVNWLAFGGREIESLRTELGPSRR